MGSADGVTTRRNMNLTPGEGCSDCVASGEKE